MADESNKSNTGEILGAVATLFLGIGAAWFVGSKMKEAVDAGPKANAPVLPNYPEAMHQARNDVMDILRTNKFYNPKLEAFWKAWRRAKGNSAIVPNLNEANLASLQHLLAEEWRLRGWSRSPTTSTQPTTWPVSPRPAGNSNSGWDRFVARSNGERDVTKSYNAYRDQIKDRG